jgi:hypothetical protein
VRKQVEQLVFAGYVAFALLSIALLTLDIVAVQNFLMPLSVEAAITLFIEPRTAIGALRSWCKIAKERFLSTL